jgi:pimeloyl-ACP methyl ester carboxylesterase
MLELFFLNWFGTELIHYLNYKKVVNFVKKKINHPPAKNFDHTWMEKFWLYELEPSELKEWIKNSINYAEVENDQYYKSVPFDQLSKDKMLKWVSYHLYYRNAFQLTNDEMENSKIVLGKIENKIGITFLDQGDPNVYFLKFGANHIESNYIPYTVSAALQVVKFSVYNVMRVCGFKKYRTKKTNILYFYHHNDQNTETIVFIHGLGIGFTPYLTFLLELKTKANLLVIVLPNISNMDYRVGYGEPTEDKLFPCCANWREAFKSIMIAHNIKEVNILAHSFGTVILAILLRDPWINQRVKKRIYVDPVCFIDECYKIYRYINDPHDGRGGIFAIISNFLVYRDIHVRYATQRFLYGPEFYIYDYDSMNNDNNLVVLSKNDNLVPSETLYRRFSKHNIPCLLVYDAFHADIFSGSIFKDVLSSVSNFVFHEAHNQDQQFTIQ